MKKNIFDPTEKFSPEDIKYVAYLRKSQKDEQRQVLSIPSQKAEILKAFPGLNITFVGDDGAKPGESMSAARPGRPLFNKMMCDIEAGKYEGLIAWHPDRLARNPIDSASVVWALQRGIIKDLKFCSYHFEDSADGIKQLQDTMSQAQFYSAKLSKDVRRGNVTKREVLGEVTTVPPIGYLNDYAKHQIKIDPERAPLVRKAFDLFLTGNYSVVELAEIMRGWGLATIQRARTGGKPVSPQRLAVMLHNRIYAGLVHDPRTDTWLPASHEALVSLEEIERCEEILSRHRNLKSAPKHHEFALKGLIRCAVCGCSITAEPKEKRQKNGVVRHYIYYHCTHKSKFKECHQGSIEEKDLLEQLENLLASYEISDELYNWGLRAIEEIATKNGATERVIKASLETELEELEKRQAGLIRLTTKGLLSDEKFATENQALEGRMKEVREKLEDAKAREDDWQEIIGTTLTRLNGNIHKFKSGDMLEKRMLLSALGSNPILMDKKIIITEHPWLRPVKEAKQTLEGEMEAVRTCPQQIKKTSEEGLYHAWLGMRDSNPRMVGPEPTALPRGESPTGIYHYSTNLIKINPKIFTNPHRRGTILLTIS